MKLIGLVLLLFAGVLLTGMLADMSSPLLDDRRMDARLVILTVIAFALLVAMSL